jgi:hypothetical protein
MAERKEFGLLRQMTSELDRVFDRPLGAFTWPSFRSFAFHEPAGWAPRIDVFERDNRLVTKVDLPGLSGDGDRGSNAVRPQRADRLLDRLLVGARDGAR